jgi:glycosyltransferase involved in cell wall biosynthesis
VSAGLRLRHCRRVSHPDILSRRMPAAPAIKVTVAIPTYNRADFLRQTLAGIAQQHFPREHFEVLVIDNNSTDHTRAVVEEFASAQPAPRYLVEPQQGLDYGRNRAIAEARGEIILFGDDDILVQPDWIAQMAVPLMADRERKIGAVGGEVVPVFPDGLPDWVREWHAPLAFRPDTGPLLPKDSPMGANLAFPKWIFEQLGPFHTALDRAAGNYFSGGDSEMVRRVRHAGLQVWFSPAAAVRHQMPASRTTFRYARRHAFDSARSRVIDRAGQPGAGLYFVARFVGNIAKALGFALLALLNALVFRGGAAKKALVRAWRSCGYLYQIPRSLFGQV